MERERQNSLQAKFLHDDTKKIIVICRKWTSFRLVLTFLGWKSFFLWKKLSIDKQVSTENIFKVMAWAQKLKNEPIKCEPAPRISISSILQSYVFVISALILSIYRPKHSQYRTRMCGVEHGRAKMKRIHRLTYSFDGQNVECRMISLQRYQMCS